MHSKGPELIISAFCFFDLNKRRLLFLWWSFLLTSIFTLLSIAWWLYIVGSKNLSIMQVIHYTNGYGGKYNYATSCGEEIDSHSKTDGATIDPAEVTCEKCKATEAWGEDYGYSSGNTITSIKRRIYIESDILHVTEIRDAQREVRGICKAKSAEFIKRVFAEIIDYAWHDLEKTWAAVKKADEIYANSSLMPLSGGSYTGAPVIFNGMCERAIKEQIKGKDVYILNSLENIEWYMIDIDLMRGAFKHNNLFMYNDEFSYNMEKVDIYKIDKRN
jgi:hypothetical protein